MELEVINKNCSGIYVVSFNMEKPMVYHQPFPSSNKLIDKTMIKVGKCKNIKKRMGEYRSTYGFREKEPNDGSSNFTNELLCLSRYL